jgi:ATP-dependent exoDNAse (exonuclease V) alpha subunit
VRLPWHDRGWDGCICNAPKKNVYCGGFFSVNAERIRAEKDDEWEDANSGKPCHLLGNRMPPCTETTNVFGDKVVRHTHLPKEFLEGAEKREEELPACSSGTWPFEDMWDEKGNRREPDERKDIAEKFSESLKENVSLIFYYCNYDNPVTGNEKKYLLTGIARLKQKGTFKEWPQIPKDVAEKYGDFVWSITLRNGYPNEGLRIPYHEYLDKNLDVSSIAVVISGDLARRFKYVSRHVSDDEAIGIIDQTIRSIKRVIQHGHSKNGQVDWEQKLEWLKDIRRECWESRGLYPGLASTLAYLNFRDPELYVRIELPKKKPKDQREYIFERLDGKVRMDAQEQARYGDAVERYQTLQNLPTTAIIARLCRERLPFFDLTEDQIKNILGDSRENYLVTSSLAEIFDNPYSLCEEYTGEDIEDTVGFHRIDHGMIPSEDLDKEVKRIPFDDPRRLRALMVEQLKAAARDGHTFTDRSDLFAALEAWHKESDPEGHFVLDRAIWEQHKEVFTKKLVLDPVDGVEAVFLKSVHSAERIIRKEILGLMGEERLEPSGIDWEASLRKFQSKEKGHPPIDKAIAEQAQALETLYRIRFGVLIGSAGTGKTTVLRSLIAEITKSEPNHTFLLLAPTGKAAVVLGSRVQRGKEATTIHKLLMKYGWINTTNYTLKETNNRRVGYPGTVIIDEASMLDVNLLATVIRAIDLNNAERLILVGDVGQLPPIGSGKPFADIVDYLKKDETRRRSHLAELTVNCRQLAGSCSAWLASHFCPMLERPDEEILWDVEQGTSRSDLSIHMWNSDDDLYDLISEVLETAIAEMEGGRPRRGDLGERYSNIHGLGLDQKKNLEAIQILAPYRHTPSGVAYLNQVVQELLRAKEVVKKYQIAGYVYFDKIMQIRNRKYWAWDHDSEKRVKNEDTYVPNGALGYVFPQRRRSSQLQVKFPDDFIRFSYYLGRSQCADNIELGYATSVHKGQGSQFDTTIVVIPAQASDFLSRELLYTALSRSTGKMFLLLQKGADRILKERTWAGYSEIVRRNSSLFRTAKGIPRDGFKKFHPDELVYEPLPELLVRSREESLIAQSLARYGVGFSYEKPLIALDGKSWRLPDFTFRVKRKEYYWEHLGMLGSPTYDKAVDRKRKWYRENGWQDKLIETPIEGMSFQESIKYVLEEKLGLSEQKPS